MSNKRARHVAIGAAIAEYLLNDFQKLELMDHSELIKTKRDLFTMRAEAKVMAQSFKHGLYGMRRDKMQIIAGPPYDAATKTGMYDHDDSG